ncbi:hypothetical protein P7C73_g5824, partial [Tremellales sp. Uapishka_1]
MTSPQQPTTARITALAHWNTFFHPTAGVFRCPSTAGASIEHLDIDLRFVAHEHGHETFAPASTVDLPRVCILTLRGGEYVQEDEGRMDCLAEVLSSIHPVEVRWLNAEHDPKEMLTFSTHLVHPAIIQAGNVWSENGSLRKLVVQGGFRDLFRVPLRLLPSDWAALEVEHTSSLPLRTVWTSWFLC